MGYEFGLYENLDAGRDSIMVVEANRNRNFFQLVAQAERDFGQYLASAEDDQDLMDRVAAVEAELREAGVNDPVSVLEALAAKDEDDDTDSDDDGSEDDSDVPDFVDTDENDSKDRKESKVAADFTGVPGGHPVVPRNVNPNPAQGGFGSVAPANVGVPGVVPDDYGMPGNPAGTPNAAPVNAPNPLNTDPTTMRPVASKTGSVLPFVPRKK